jgi:hypothetical protein
MAAGGRVLASTLALALAISACSIGGTDPGTQPKPTPSPASTSAETLRYVSPSGNDGALGSKARPWRTLGRALPALHAGQTLLVRGGVYREQLVRLDIHRGTPRKRITVQAYPGERPVVQGAVWLFRPSYWTVDGLHVTWDDSSADSPLHMVKVSGGVGWVWRNSEIWGSRGQANVLITGPGFREPSDWLFTGNCIHDVRPERSDIRGTNLSIGDMNEAGPGRVTRNLIFDAPGGRGITLGYSEPALGGPQGVDVELNTIHGADVPITVSGDTSAALIARNIIAAATSNTLVRAATLAGKGVVMRDNIGVAARFFPLDTGTLRIGGGNLVLDRLKFSKRSRCDGFQTDAAVGLAYGRYALD